MPRMFQNSSLSWWLISLLTCGSVAPGKNFSVHLSAYSTSPFLPPQFNYICIYDKRKKGCNSFVQYISCWATFQGLLIMSLALLSSEFQFMRIIRVGTGGPGGPAPPNILGGGG